MADDDLDDVFSEEPGEVHLPTWRTGLPAVIPPHVDREEAEAAFGFGSAASGAASGGVPPTDPEQRRLFDDGLHRMKEHVVCGIAAGLDEADIAETIIDPLTGAPMSMGRFRSVFAHEIRTGATALEIDTVKSLRRIAVNGSEAKGAAAQVSAAGFLLERRFKKRWQKEQVIETRNPESDAKAGQALDSMKQMMDGLAAAKRGKVHERG